LVGSHGRHSGQIFDAIGHGAGTAQQNDREHDQPWRFAKMSEFVHDNLME